MMDEAVRSLTRSGIHVAVSAGNDNQPANLASPAREETACTVGASDIKDARAPFSNYGTPVKVFAPGVSITSAWIGSNTVRSYPFRCFPIRTHLFSEYQYHFGNVHGIPSCGRPYGILDLG